ncbi:hypothetical protein ANAPC1_00214 [Anaplasma phagocytophilum]|uniref:Uncharacterized protein n=4 Tax=Anaplasma phagocytophilum TaxID=948 RepID=A0AA45US75_ANAPH|nr:hypothetical protein APH_0194 [Anaplasma phagocytophilum str. HZ]AGR79225.1 hypothetical protein YYU_00935 [Anaplasma phagocytophilum str. HZ2]AGR80470.1 hypothetical protein WSQ_00925 [Anaplasma phagocytophilum str. JM]AGR81728.1 hypothetical protein YYY_00940 [Anaplasma phagocytophilum str. Dog2]EOA61777.1 hypothetical protein HGE1_00835 [Anaplasma phagocytophilum str. HGE1]KJV60126.1 putative membrane protein [Anaplasma phagocytophilum str. Webster]KJV63884.1 putative membrane protein [
MRDEHGYISADVSLRTFFLLFIVYSVFHEGNAVLHIL